MPIYEYHCNGCECDFEKIVFSSTEEIECPECHDKKVTKLMSGFCVKSGDSFTGPTGGSSCSGCTSSSCDSCH